MTFRAARSTSHFSVSVEALTSVVGRMIVRGFNSTPYSTFLLEAMAAFRSKNNNNQPLFAYSHDAATLPIIIALDGLPKRF